MRIKRRLHKSDLEDINYKIDSLIDCLDRLKKVINEPKFDIEDVRTEMIPILAWPYRIKESLEKSISSIGKEM
ncbi:hypothetical protein QNH23_06395 [Siminovitchia fortis]|uniref:Uncharacterized protein n=1 Tax=Siminovitchia fortis TaxID=254758 RepID=A0A443IMR4_9BACI|nr:hypothetical protein [Siminovitchia fortis]RWR06733.1 hypothetical protein D4N35_013795 [Siminovitchia fortis]WHY83001.1 hypothetical protein QNH23_06395 [Siminovitchia fortis]